MAPKSQNTLNRLRIVTLLYPSPRHPLNWCFHYGVLDQRSLDRLQTVAKTTERKEYMADVQQQLLTKALHRMHRTIPTVVNR